MNEERILRTALDSAISRYYGRVGEPFHSNVKLDPIDRPDFHAVVFPTTDGICIEASNSVVERLAAVWEKVNALSSDLPAEHQLQLLGDPDHVVDMALRWLMQHELNHAAVGHFKLTDGAALVEGGGEKAFSAATRRSRKPSPLEALPETDQKLASLCLELQADHDATEIVLGAYSAENHTLFRYYAICIALVIFVIEQVDRENAREEITHPKASTRLFQLLAYLVELPYIPAYKRAYAEGLTEMPEDYLPPRDELERYSADVFAPVFAACEIMAEAIELPGIINELGGVEAFFADINRAVFEGHDSIDAFVTPCAVQWASLKPLNERLLKMLGWK
ncbi:hypothetical protein SAMN05421688_1508 [Poseidonocella pacifica]|uniref:Peptidase U49 n=1 Tax=Poseidonocella pacifica TaxID=871651 RepID=A0A1I0WJP7_9RHOB|nr:hypothetical protein [Poseidonocella pacifica]SFA88979.1 hypothetical protein SAMN05421688_1508 [Poseidonocella pacifica]